MKTPPVFFDDGHDGTWLDMIHHSPCLNVSDYPGDDQPESLESGGARSFGAPTLAGRTDCKLVRPAGLVSPFHTLNDSAGGANNRD